MAIAETILFLDDKMHAWETAVSIYGVSSTTWGAPENVRDTAYWNGWKPSDGTADEYIQVDGGSVGWLGTAGGGTITFVCAYDTRLSDQTGLNLREDAADSPTGGFVSNQVTMALTANVVAVNYATFPLTASGKRYYRLWQLNANRGGSNRPAKILAWGMFKASGVLNIDTGYPNGNVSPGASDVRDNVGHLLSPGGFDHVQTAARMQHDFEVHIRRATKTLWNDLLTGFNIAAARAFYVQYEGLKNVARADFQMARLGSNRWMSQRPYLDNFETSIPMVTEPHA